MSIIEIRNRRIQAGEPVYFIAEIGINHNGDMNLASEMIESVARTGADAVKFQTFKAERLADPSKNQELYDLFKLNELDRAAHEYLRDKAHENNLAFISTPFDEDCAAMLHECGVDAFKVASGDLTNYPLLKKIASYRLPVILSTGMGYLSEIASALEVLSLHGAKEILVLHCVSSYPPDDVELNLRSIISMTENLGCQTGYSDHYIGDLAAITAITLGSVCIEKHFTIDKNLDGPDQRLSADEGELRTLIEKAGIVRCMLGDGIKKPSPREALVRKQGRQGVYAAVNIDKGMLIEKKHLKIARPEAGLSASRIDDVIGKTALVNIRAGSPISPDVFQKRTKPALKKTEIRSESIKTL